MQTLSIEGFMRVLRSSLIVGLVSGLTVGAIAAQKGLRATNSTYVPTERIGAKPLYTRFPALMDSENSTRVPLPGFKVPSIPSDRVVTPMTLTEPMSGTVFLHRNNESEMVPLLNKIYNPNDPLFHRYLTVSERRAKFSPSLQTFQIPKPGFADH